jgi:hypothetical protein
VGFDVPESCDILEAVVDGLAAATGLTQDVPVFEAGGDVFDASADAVVFAVVVVVDDPAAVVALWADDGERQPGFGIAAAAVRCRWCVVA